MRKFILFIFLCFYSICGNSQTGIKVIFETRRVITEESVKSIPAQLRADFVKQYNSIKKESSMYLQEGKVFFEVQAAEVKNSKLGKLDSNETEGKVLLAKEMSTIVTYAAEKLIKDPKYNSYTERKPAGLVTKKLVIAKWQLTKKTKKILGYTCYEAVTTFNNKVLTVYYTRQLRATGSPDKLPFIDGVVLAYTYGIVDATAVKIALKQPLITKFL
tara:strand:- start:502 stop:1149 length:648 start_codon:yes stop_codon:yes gene_type:complete